MSQDLTLKNVPKEVEDAINSATNASDLRELMLSAMAKAGIVVRTQDDEFNIRLMPQALAPEQSVPARGFKFERTIRFHPSTGKRALVIRGNTEEDLNALEAQILGY